MRLNTSTAVLVFVAPGKGQLIFYVTLLVVILYSTTCPGPLGALNRPWRFPPSIGFLWRFCMGAQGA